MMSRPPSASEGHPRIAPSTVPVHRAPAAESAQRKACTSDLLVAPGWSSLAGWAGTVPPPRLTRRPRPNPPGPGRCPFCRHGLAVVPATGSSRLGGCGPCACVGPLGRTTWYTAWCRLCRTAPRTEPRPLPSPPRPLSTSIDQSRSTDWHRTPHGLPRITTRDPLLPEPLLSTSTRITLRVYPTTVESASGWLARCPCGREAFFPGRPGPGRPKLRWSQAAGETWTRERRDHREAPAALQPRESLSPADTGHFNRSPGQRCLTLTACHRPYFARALHLDKVPLGGDARLLEMSVHRLVRPLGLDLAEAELGAVSRPSRGSSWVTTNGPAWTTVTTTTVRPPRKTGSSPVFSLV